DLRTVGQRTLVVEHQAAGFVLELVDGRCVHRRANDRIDIVVSGAKTRAPQVMITDAFYTAFTIDAQFGDDIAAVPQRGREPGGPVRELLWGAVKPEFDPAGGFVSRRMQV